MNFRETGVEPIEYNGLNGAKHFGWKVLLDDETYMYFGCCYYNTTGKYPKDLDVQKVPENAVAIVDENNLTIYNLIK